MLLFEASRCLGIINPPKAGSYAKIFCVSPPPASGTAPMAGTETRSRPIELAKSHCSNSLFAIASRRLGSKQAYLLHLFYYITQSACLGLAGISFLKIKYFSVYLCVPHYATLWYSSLLASHRRRALALRRLGS